MKLQNLIALTSFLVAPILGSDVAVLTQENFHKTVEGNEFVLAEFYAPWCGHCKKLAPEYEKAATALKETHPNVVIAKIDATAEKDLAGEFGVKGFPTLKWFVDGKVMEYTGGRDEKTIISWVSPVAKKTGPPAKTVTTADELEEFKKEADAVAHGIFPSESSEEAQAFIAIAKGDDSTPYAVEYKEGVEPKVTIFQQFDDGKAEFSGNLVDQAALKAFIDSNLLPSVIPFSQEIAGKVFSGSIREHVLLFVESEDEGKKIADAVRPVARDEAHSTKFMFMTVPKTQTRIVDFFGVKGNEVPTVRIAHMKQGGVDKFKAKEAVELTEAGVRAFVEQYIAGEALQDLKSEEPLSEEDQAKENVKIFVGKDFEEQVNKPGTDVLVEFYAPWCGHCKKLAPEYEKVAEHFKDKSSVIIAKLDATANEVARVPISGFPTLKFFPADSDEIVDYNGGRTEKDIVAFLEENSKSLK
eukprot:snap_masked-scaffold_6-processed-gene-13.45-mRNA-1 protein AED:0.04 eAED:0.04 QI:379/0.75/0.8/1/0.75/0.6/5/48/469